MKEGFLVTKITIQMFATVLPLINAPVVHYLVHLEVLYLPSLQYPYLLLLPVVLGVLQTDSHNF